jgi:hypothetical protein
MPLTRRSILGRLLLFSLALLCGSCGSNNLQPVRGKVTYRNTPTPGAAVFLHPLDESLKSSGVVPCGRVQDDGSFQITTHKLNDGVQSGRYAVTVIWLTRPRIGDSDQQDLLPPRYSDPRTSGLNIDVKDGANELEPFRLND